MNSEDVRLLRKLARFRGMRISQLCRLMILEWLGRHGYLDEERMKALGLSEEQHPKSCHNMTRGE